MTGAAIAYDAKWHQMVSTSSTEAEFVQVMSTAKIAKYLRIILKELCIKQKGPIIIYEDNATAIMITNASKLNGRTGHIDISCFAIQEWVEKGNIKLAHI
eukprot:1463436-Ditylum_brightwellii.AAC.1